MRGALLAVPLLLAFSAVAGCLSTAEGPIPEEPPATVPTTLWVLDKLQNPLPVDAFAGELPRFDIVKVSDRISGEPTIGITRTGALFYPAIDFDGVNGFPLTHFMRSTDGGETWLKKSPQMAGQETHLYSFDPYVYTDPTTGRVFAMDMGPSVYCNKVSWSDDDGETWVTREGACVPFYNDHPTIFAGPATASTNVLLYPNQVYLCTNQIYDSMCYQSPDGGITWIPTQPAFVDCGGLTGHGHASFADGTVYLGRDWCGRASVAVSRDGGVTWTPVTIAQGEKLAPSGHDVSIGTDASGTAYALWIGDEARSVWLSVSKDKGATWGEPMNVTAPGVTAVKFPSLVAGAEGRIAFLYVGTENPHGHRVGALREGCTDRADPKCFEDRTTYNHTTWNAYIGMSLNAADDQPVFVTTLANPIDEPLKRGACSGRCMGNDDGPEGQPGSGGMYDFLDIDIDPRTGVVYAALVDVCSAECDGYGKGKFVVEEHSLGVVARMIAGTRLLDEPIQERAAVTRGAVLPGAP